jgi:hypothetical protein
MANKSSYARFFICFNPMKPTGKFHFKIYMDCCAESNLTLRIKIHTKDNADTEAGENYDEFINRLDNLTLQLCRNFSSLEAQLTWTITICPQHAQGSYERMVYFAGVPSEVVASMSHREFNFHPPRPAHYQEAPIALK